MTHSQHYQHWLNSPALDEAERAELLSIQGDELEIKERFFAPLAFGTAGLRGTMAVGLHNMNRHIIRHTTQAFANLIRSEGQEAMRRGVAVAYDCRNNSPEFAHAAACVLAGNGIHVRLFESLRPTPELSFAIRKYGCIAGINVTASHNPKEYNGYKVYWEDGAQLPPEHADVVAKECQKTPMFAGVSQMGYDQARAQGLIEIMGAETDDAFMAEVLRQSVTREYVKNVADRFKIVFTPFHGAGHQLVPRALRETGFRHVIPVPEQMEINGDFPTVTSPNPEPENREGFALAIALAEKENADLIIGTDPDADRVGVLVRDAQGAYTQLTGNQAGALLLDYIIKGRKKQDTLPPSPALITTIVSSSLPVAIAEKNGAAAFKTFTGFKFMAEKIKEMEAAGSHQFILAFEESYGYLVGDFARDKDAVGASMLMAEMAAFHAAHGRTLLDALALLFDEYGYCMDETVNLVMPGIDGMEKMNAIMHQLRQGIHQRPIMHLAGNMIAGARDYLTGEQYDRTAGTVKLMDIKGSNVLGFDLADGSELMIRPSGTEPKIKVYILAKGESRADCADKVKAYRDYALALRDM